MARTSLMARIVSIALTVMVLTLNIGLDARSALADAPIAQDASQPSVSGPIFQSGESVSWLGLGSSSLRPLTMLAQECVPAGSEESASPDATICDETVQEPVVEEPVYQDPVVEEPVYQEPVVEEPVVEEPTTEPVTEPTTEPEPTVEATNEPSAPPAETTPDATVEATEEATTPEAEATATEEGVSTQGVATSGDFTLSVIPSTGVAVPGNNVNFTVTLTNNGDGTAFFVGLFDTLPAGTWTVTGACSNTAASGSLDCQLGNLASGASRTITVSRAITNADCGATLTNLVEAYNYPDPNPDSGGDVESVDGDVSVALLLDPYIGFLSESDSIQVVCPDLSVSKTGNGPLSAGDTASYTIVLTPGGTGTSSNVTLTDALPAGIDWSITSISGGTYDGPPCAITEGTLSCGFGDLASGNTRTVVVSGLTDAADCGTLSNTAVGGATIDINTTNNSSTATITVGCPDLTVSKSTSTGTVDSGDPVDFTITVSNGGTGTASNVTLTDQLPGAPDMTWTVTSPASGCSVDASGLLNCTFTSLAAGASQPVTVTSTVPEDRCTPDLTNDAATVSATNEAAGATGNNTSGTSTIDILCPSLTLTKGPDPEDAGAVINAGETASFSIVVGNDGPGRATNVELVDTLPAGTWTVATTPSELCPTSATGELECQLGDLESGSSVTISVSRATSAADCSEPLENSATAGADNLNVESNPSDSAAITVLCPDLTVSKGTSTGDVDSGDPVDFTLTVSNGGPGRATGVTLTDQLPVVTGLTWTVNPAVTGCSVDASGLLSCTFPDALEAGGSQAVTVTGTVPNEFCGTLTNDGATTSATNEQATENNTQVAAATITVRCPDLRVAKSAVDGTIISTETAAFEIDVENLGPGIAFEVDLTDTLPAGDWTITPPAGWSCEDGSADTFVATDSFTCTIDALAPTGDSPVTFRVERTTALAECPTTLTNDVALSAANNDEVTSSADVVVQCPAPAALEVSKTASVTTAAPGDTITYLYLITNTGGVTAFDVMAVDDLGTSGFVGDDEVVCDGLTILPGTTVQCTFDVVVSDLFAGSDLTNVVTVTGTSALGGISIASATAVATVTIVAVEELEPCSFPVVFIFVSDIEFASADGTPLFTINQGSQLTFPSGSQSGGGCESDDWTFTGSINGQPASFSFKGTLRPNGTTASAGVRALPMLATSDLVLEITEINTVNWDVSGLPEPQAPVAVQFSTAPTGTRLEVAGVNAEVSISPDLEVPFQSINEYHISKASLPDVGSGQWSIGGGASGLPLGLITILPVLLLLLATRLRGGNALRTARVTVRARRAR